jgi:hypothetical protein
MSFHTAVAYTNQVAALVRGMSPGLLLSPPSSSTPCDSSPDNCKPRFAWIINTGALDPHGHVRSPVAAANIAAGVLGAAQTSSGGSGGQGGGSGGQSGGSGSKREPLGELVSINLELTGLRNRPVFLSWSIFQKGGQNNLFGKWLSNFVAYRLEATTNDDTGTLEMWIPLPKVPGPYFIHLSLTTGGASLASTNSDPFD